MNAKDTGERCDWTVTGMDCASCATKITTALQRLPGVADVHVAVMAKRLTLSLDADVTPEEKIEGVVLRAMAATGHMMMIGDGINDAPAQASDTVGLPWGLAAM